MKINNKNLLLAGLLGSKVAKKLPRFEALENELAKHVLPPKPFLPLKNKSRFTYQEVDWNDKFMVMPEQIPEDKQFFPVKIRNINDSQWYLLPYEPMITISGKNNIIKREVAKKGNDKNLFGTIKEYWSQDDYEITITGALYGALETGSVDDCYPKEDFRALKEFILNPQGIEIDCQPLKLLDITRIVVEDFTFPFTKGENVQAYEIKAVSDSTYDLFKLLND